MNDKEFLAWLRGYAYAKQGDGYEKIPDDFIPIIPVFRNGDGSLNRQRMLELPCFSEIAAGQVERLQEVCE